MSQSGATTAWTSRVLVGPRIGEPAPPPWLQSSYAIFREILLRPGYPCYFGAAAEQRGELFYSYVEQEKIGHLPQTLRTFIDVTAPRTTERNNLAVFFEPDATPLTHAAYRARFWKCLQYLHDHDNVPTSPEAPLDPDDPRWEFPFGGTQFFVVGVSPSYRRRRSRNLGPGMLMLFQPRAVFLEDVTGRPLGMPARLAVRRRLLSWDEAPVHPDLSVYGHPDNREWKQYVLPDDEQAATNQCPLAMHRHCAPLASTSETAETHGADELDSAALPLQAGQGRATWP